jgi:hypothetical protein
VANHPYRYPDHTLSAPMWRTASAAVLEAFFTCLTFGLSLLVSAGLTFATPQRQTCGQLLTRTYAVRETSRPVSVPIYSTTPSTSMSPVSREQHHLSDQQGVSGGHRRPFSSAKPTSSGHEWQTPDGDVPEFSGWRAAAAGKSPARRSSIDVADPASVLAHHAGSQPGLPGTAAPSVQPPTRSPVVRMGTGITNTVNNTSGIFGRVASRLGNIGHATSPSVAARPSAGDVGVSYPPYGSPSLAAGLAPGSAQQQMRARRPLPPDGQVRQHFMRALLSWVWRSDGAWDMPLARVTAATWSLSSACFGVQHPQLCSQESTVGCVVLQLSAGHLWPEAST